MTGVDSWAETIRSLGHEARWGLVDDLRAAGMVDEAWEAEAVAEGMDEDEREARWSRC